MKTRLFFAIMLAIFCAASPARSQDTLVGWTFPAASADSLSDLGIPLNSARFLSCQYGSWGAPTYYGISSIYTLTGAEGGTDKCAAASGWDNGADSVYWMIKFKSTGYHNLMLYSRQSSDSLLPGPRDFKVQYKLSGSSIWNDLSGGLVSCDAGWSSGVISGLALPSTCDNQSGQVSLRWLQTSNTDISGGTVAATGISMIDDIIITGEALSGMTELTDSKSVRLSPNPCSNGFTPEHAVAGSRIEIFNTSGSSVYTEANYSGGQIQTAKLLPGLYMVGITQPGGERTLHKLIVE